MIKHKIASDFLILFFGRLEEQNIDYAVLRNHEGLPDHNSSKDVDLLFRNSDVIIAKNIALDIAENIGYKCIWKNPLDYLEGLVFVKQRDDIIFSVKLDLFNGLKWRGFAYCDSHQILRNRLSKNVQVLDSVDEAIIMICYYSLYAKYVRVKYRENLLVAIESENFSLRFRQLTGLIWERCELNTDQDWKNLCQQLRIRFKRKFALSLKEYGGFIRSAWLEYATRLRFGAFLTVSGYDGCGKSSLLDSLIKGLYTLGICDSALPDHLLSAKVPAPHQLFKRTKRRAESSYDKPYSSGEVGNLQSLVRLVYYFVAFSLDRLLRFWRMRRNTVVIYDRYVIDFLVDTTRFRIRNNLWIGRLFRFFIKNKHIKIIVLVEPGVSVERKNELTMEKAESLYNSYLEKAAIFPGTVVFFNNSEIKTSIINFNNLVFEALENHYESV